MQTLLARAPVYSAADMTVKRSMCVALPKFWAQMESKLLFPIPVLLRKPLLGFAQVADSLRQGRIGRAVPEMSKNCCHNKQNQWISLFYWHVDGQSPFLFVHRATTGAAARTTSAPPRESAKAGCPLAVAVKTGGRSAAASPSTAIRLLTQEKLVVAARGSSRDLQLFA